MEIKNRQQLSDALGELIARHERLIICRKSASLDDIGAQAGFAKCFNEIMDALMPKQESIRLQRLRRIKERFEKYGIESLGRDNADIVRELVAIAITEEESKP